MSMLRFLVWMLATPQQGALTHDLLVLLKPRADAGAGAYRVLPPMLAYYSVLALAAAEDPFQVSGGKDLATPWTRLRSDAHELAPRLWVTATPSSIDAG